MCVLLQGKPLYEILAAGEWRSPAFLSYMDLHKLDADLVLQSHVDEESDDDAVLIGIHAASAAMLFDWLSGNRKCLGALDSLVPKSGTMW